MALRRLTMIVSLAACSMLALPEGYAQFQNDERQSGYGNQSGITGQGRGGRSNSAFGGSQQNSGFGGQTGFGGSQRNGFGAGQQGQLGGSQLGAGLQQPGITGQGPGGQGGFVGGDAQDMRASFENMNGRQRRRVMFDFMLENLNQMRDRRAERDARRRQPDLVRVQLRAPVNLPLVDSQQAAVTLQGNLTRSIALQGLSGGTAGSGPQVRVVDRTAIVSGTVASDHERAVIAKMVSLQPGVSLVENQLTVEPTSGKAPSTPATEAVPAAQPVP